MAAIFVMVGVALTLLLWIGALYFVNEILNGELERQKRILRLLTKKFVHSSFLPRWGSLRELKEAKDFQEWVNALRKQVRAVALRYSITVLFFFLLGFLALSKDLKAFLFISFILAPLAGLYSLYLTFVYLLMKKTNNQGVYHFLDQFPDD